MTTCFDRHAVETCRHSWLTFVN